MTGQKGPHNSVQKREGLHPREEDKEADEAAHREAPCPHAREAGEGDVGEGRVVVVVKVDGVVSSVGVVARGLVVEDEGGVGEVVAEAAVGEGVEQAQGHRQKSRPNWSIKNKVLLKTDWLSEVRSIHCAHKQLDEGDKTRLST